MCCHTPGARNRHAARHDGSRVSLDLGPRHGSSRHAFVAGERRVAVERVTRNHWVAWPWLFNHRVGGNAGASHCLASPKGGKRWNRGGTRRAATSSAASSGATPGWRQQVHPLASRFGVRQPCAAFRMCRALPSRCRSKLQAPSPIRLAQPRSGRHLLFLAPLTPAHLLYSATGPSVSGRHEPAASPFLASPPAGKRWNSSRCGE